MQKKQREYWVDSVKVIACILVILGHFFQSMVTDGIIEKSSAYLFFNQTIYLFHVPLFFICSGYLYQKYSRADSLKHWGTNVAKKLFALGIPYFVFSGINYILKLFFSQQVHNQNRNILESLFITPEAPFWYLYCLFFLFFFVPTISKKSQAAVLISAASVIHFAMYLSFNKVTLPYFIYNTGIYMIWFALGILIGYIGTAVLKHKFLPWFFPLFFAAAIITFYLNIDNAAVSFLLGISACTGIVSFVILRDRDAAPPPPPPIRFLAKHTMPLYLLHTICAAGVRNVLNHFGITSAVVHIALGLTAAFVLPVIAGMICDRLKPLDFLFYPSRYMKIGKSNGKDRVNCS